MKIGVTVPQVGPIAERRSLLAAAHAAEDVGLSSLWVSDHVAFPTTKGSAYPYSRDGRLPFEYDSPFLEALVCLGFLAASTDYLTIGTSVLVLPLRNTILAAKQLGTVSALAPGRLIVGLGAGWLREEFELLNARFDRRGEVLHEQVRALRGLWNQKGYQQSGDHVAFPGMLMEPRPSAMPEIWVGGTSGSALRRAGRLGDAWHAIGTRDPEDLKAKMEKVTEAAVEAGRPPEAVRLTARIGARRGQEGAEILQQRLHALAELGCEHVVVDPSITDASELVSFYGTLAKISEGVATRA